MAELWQEVLDGLGFSAEWALSVVDQILKWERMSWNIVITHLWRWWSMIWRWWNEHIKRVLGLRVLTKYNLALCLEKEQFMLCLPWGFMKRREGKNLYKCFVDLENTCTSFFPLSSSWNLNVNTAWIEFWMNFGGLPKDVIELVMRKDRMLIFWLDQWIIHMMEQCQVRVWILTSQRSMKCGCSKDLCHHLSFLLLC